MYNKIELTHLVAIGPWTWAALFIRRTAILPSLLNFGGVCVCRSTSSLISARALSSLVLMRISFGLFASRRACHAERTSNLDVRLAAPHQYFILEDTHVNLRAFISDTASFIAFLVCVLKTSVISGKGGFHFKVLPRSPCVPIAQR